MIRFVALVCLLAGSMAWGQTSSATPASGHGPEEKATHPGAQVAPDAAVVTIEGFCPAQSAKTSEHASDCKTVITRAEFEKLVEAVQPQMDAQTKRQLAHAYPQFLEMAQEAEQRGLDKEPRFANRMAFARLQILSQELVRQIHDEAAQVPQKKLEDYYQKHSADFEYATLERVVIPLRAQAAAASKTPDDMSKEAEQIRARAAAGEDFGKLQKEVYDFAGMSGNTATNPNMGKIRRRGLPPGHTAVFDLKVGDVSQLISDTTGHYVYKVDAKSTEPLDSVKQEISMVLERDRAQQMIQSVEQPFTTKVNDAYFGESKDRD